MPRKVKCGCGHIMTYVGGYHYRCDWCCNEADADNNGEPIYNIDTDYYETDEWAEEKSDIYRTTRELFRRKKRF